MTRGEALKAAEQCFKEVKDSNSYRTNEAQAARLQALAEAGKGFILLANSMRLD